MQNEVDEGGLKLQMRLAGRDPELVIPESTSTAARRAVRTILREPFSRRTWRELLWFVVSSPLAAIALFVIGVTLSAGAALVVTFIGLFVIATAVRIARGFGGWHRELARALLSEEIEQPEAFSPRPGAIGWVQSGLRDRIGWRAIGYVVVKIPLCFTGVLTAFSVWVFTAACLLSPLTHHHPDGPFVVRLILRPGYFTVLGRSGLGHGLWVFLTGVVFFFIAPWPMRFVVHLDRLLLRGLLGPDPVLARTRNLERARTQTVDASAATLRRIERDLHDGTQAQLVALAMRLGQAKEVLESPEAASEAHLDEVRRLVEEAHKGAKEAIVELRDLARGIHPPVLDTGLEGALATLAARTPIPTEVTVAVAGRPTPAIEAIAYFCVAELLANVAQHSKAANASISCIQHGGWLRVVVRDEGRGGAQVSEAGSPSSGLAGLSERVRGVDGHLEIASPPGGPTVVTVDLPLHA